MIDNGHDRSLAFSGISDHPMASIRAHWAVEIT
jgi:hypothetical protein